MATTADGDPPAWHFERRPWGGADLLALAVWTIALAAFFGDVLGLRRALFYFDITEINFPYRDFLARELRAGRFSRWCPDLYCGHPLYSESQAGYLHPLKYLLSPWLPTWQAFNLDTVVSIWLTGLATYGWLRRHVGAVGALSGASIFGLSGFMWSHLVHTSMNNALTSVPLVVWALEAAWEGGRLRPMALGAVALACQVFAGHLQDTILTSGLVACYGLYRACTGHRRLAALGMAAGLIALGIVLSAVQWIPSKELLDRSPRAGGLRWEKLTYGSWSPELLPTLLVREAFGTRSHDTDWTDGFYPYQEMDVSMSVLGLALAVIGAAAWRERWVGFWIVLAGVGGLLMLGRFTFLFDVMHRIPVIGSARIPVRYHLWVALAVSALAAVGADRLAQLGRVRLGPAAGTILALALASVPILYYCYEPLWDQPGRWSSLPYHVSRTHWLRDELRWGVARTGLLAVGGFVVMALAARSRDQANRARLAALLPLIVLADLFGSHWREVPTVAPAYWTEPPESARLIRSDPSFVRVLGTAARSSSEPGYAVHEVDFLAVRDALGWSLPPVWGLASSRGETPIVSRRVARFQESRRGGSERLDLQGVTHLATGYRVLSRLGPGVAAGAAFVHRNPDALPRARLAGRPVYVSGEKTAAEAVEKLGPALRTCLVVEDPERPLSGNVEVSGTASIRVDRPERVVVTTKSPGPAYLVLADTFDPGWSATLDGAPVPIRPANLMFRAVYVPGGGTHTIDFRYEPAGFRSGLGLSVFGLFVAFACLVRRSPIAPPAPMHGPLPWLRGWPWLGLALIGLIVLASTIAFDREGRVRVQERWEGSFHRFTWGAGIEAMKLPGVRENHNITT